jgi:hypothetical protein
MVCMMANIWRQANLIFIIVLSAAVLVACNSTPTPAVSQQRQTLDQRSGRNLTRTPPVAQPIETPEMTTPTPAEKQQPTPTPTVFNPTPAVTAGNVQVAIPMDISAVLETNPRVYVGLCFIPVTFTFNGTITSSAAGTVTYHFTRSDGYSEKQHILTFNEPGMQAISTSWTMVGQPQNVVGGWVSLVIDSPHSLPLAKSAFTMNCVQGAFNGPAGR